MKATRTIKRCPQCKQTLPATAFSTNPARSDGLSSWCRSCKNAVPQKPRTEQQKRGIYIWRLREVFGMTIEGLRSMLAEQNNRCAICKKTEAESPGTTRGKFDIDHVKSPRRVRGLLCKRCNHLLGAFRDNPAAIEAAIAYLKAHSHQP